MNKDTNIPELALLHFSIVAHLSSSSSDSNTARYIKDKSKISCPCTPAHVTHHIYLRIRLEDLEQLADVLVTQHLHRRDLQSYPRQVLPQLSFVHDFYCNL